MRWIVKRVVRIAAVLLLGGLFGATLVRLAPGYGVDEEDLDSRLNHDSMSALHQAQQQEGLGSFYLGYLNRLLHGDLGESNTLHEPVRRLIAERLPETLLSVAVGLAFGWTLGLLMAIAAVMSRPAFVQTGMGFIATLLLCMPAAVLALLFVIVQAPGRIVVGLIVFPRIFHYARNLLERSASLPHVLMARAKGLGSTRVLIWHILPVAAPPLGALVGVSVCLAFAAAIPIEVLCDMPGIGQLAWKAAMGRDLPLLVNLTMLVTLITLLANSAGELGTPHERTGQR